MQQVQPTSRIPHRGRAFEALAVAAVTVAMAGCSSSAHRATDATTTTPRSTTSTTPQVSPTDGASTTVASSTTAPAPSTTTTVGFTATSIPTSPPPSCASGSSPSIYDKFTGMYATSMKTYDAATRTLRYDVIQWLVGEQAVAAYQQDNPGVTDGPPNDYYTRNVNPAIYAATLADDVVIYDIADPSGPALHSDTVAGLVARIQAGMGAGGTYQGNIMWVRLGGGKVTELCEQWVP